MRILSRMEKAKRNSHKSDLLDGSTVLVVEQVFATIGKLSADSYRANRLPLLNLPEDIRAALASGQIEYTKARAIAKVKDARLREQLLKEAIEKALSLTEIKQRIDENQSSKLEQQSPSLKDAYKSLSRELAKSSVLEDPQKKKALNKLLAQIQALLSQDGS